MKKLLFVCLGGLLGLSSLNAYAVDVTNGPLQQAPELCAYGYNPNCRGSVGSGGSSAPRRLAGEDPDFQQNLDRMMRFVQCTPEGSGQVCQHWYDKERQHLQTVAPYNQNSRKHGMVRNYWENGKLQSVENYRDGTMVGETQEYDRDGQLSLLTYYNDNGSIIRAQKIVNGKPHGAEAFFRYDAKGKLHLDRVVQWENGKAVSDKPASAYRDVLRGSSAKSR